MISFDYLRSAKPGLLARLTDTRIPVRFHAAVTALAGAAAFACGLCSIESCRLNSALQIQADYQRRYEDSAQRLAAANVLYDRVRRLAALDARVRTIVRSGDEDANTLARIANAIPDRVWLTSISHDRTGITLEGTAQDLSGVAQTIRRVTLTGGLHDALLVKTNRADDAQNHGKWLTYTLRSEAPGR